RSSCRSRSSCATASSPAKKPTSNAASATNTATTNAASVGGFRGFGREETREETLAKAPRPQRKTRIFHEQIVRSIWDRLWICPLVGSAPDRQIARSL